MNASRVRFARLMMHKEIVKRAKSQARFCDVKHAISLDISCVCGGPHRIIRMVQSGDGREAMRGI